MAAFILPPTFTPPQAPIPIGVKGQVLTNVGGRLAMAAAAGGSGGFLGARLAYASAAGTIANVSPGGGFPGTSGAPIGSLIVTLASGSATWTSLKTGLAQQLLWIYNDDAVNTLELEPGVPGSAGFSEFSFVGLLALPPQASALLLMDTTLGEWLIQ